MFIIFRFHEVVVEVLHGRREARTVYGETKACHTPVPGIWKCGYIDTVVVLCAKFARSGGGGTLAIHSLKGAVELI